VAKYLVLEFEDDKDADGLVEGLNAVGYILSASENSSMWKSYPIIAGVFKKPTMFCECPPSNNPKSVRGAKWGWWLHKDCGKPRKGNTHHPRNLIIPKEARGTDYLYIGVNEPRQDAGQAAEV
jgi:hypothetical protein